MKKKYSKPTMAPYSINSDELLISVSTGTGVNLNVTDQSDGDAAEALAKPFEQDGWEW